MSGLVAAGGEITFRPVVWPTYAGALLADGSEPMSHLNYIRGQINWQVNDAGLIIGHTTIAVPAGEWCWVIYCHHPSAPQFSTVQKLAHPLRLIESGSIELDAITEADVRPTMPDPVVRD